MSIYESSMKRSQLSLDAVAFTCAVRAAGLSRRPLPFVLQLLDEAHAAVGNQSLSVVHTAMTTYKFVPHPQPVSECLRLLDWLQKRALRPSQQTLVGG